MDIRVSRTEIVRFGSLRIIAWSFERVLSADVSFILFPSPARPHRTMRPFLNESVNATLVAIVAVAAAAAALSSSSSSSSFVVSVGDLDPEPDTDARNGGLPLAAPSVAVRGFRDHCLALDRFRNHLAVLKGGCRLRHNSSRPSRLLRTNCQYPRELVCIGGRGGWLFRLSCCTV